MLIADRWRSDRFAQDNGIAQHQRAIAFTKLRGRALDLGCGGSGRLIDLLLKHGFSPEGLDISSKMLELARSRHPGVPFHQADISQWQFPQRYDFISAWDSIDLRLRRHPGRSIPAWDRQPEVLSMATDGCRNPALIGCPAFKR